MINRYFCIESTNMIYIFLKYLMISDVSVSEIYDDGIGNPW